MREREVLKYENLDFRIFPNYQGMVSFIYKHTHVQTQILPFQNTPCIPQPDLVTPTHTHTHTKANHVFPKFMLAEKTTHTEESSKMCFSLNMSFSLMKTDTNYII